MNTDDSWIRYINERGERFKEWRGKQQEMQQLAEQSIYIRVGGNKFKPVSLHPENPCGRLKTKKDKVINGTKGLDLSLKNAREAAPANTFKPGNQKPEHIVQAGLIHHALTHNLLLNDRFLGFAEFFSDLIFITDELRAGDKGEIRADIIALGGKKGSYFPVFIELKAIRSLQRVVEQLRDAHEKMAIARDSFIKMLADATGKEQDKIVFDEYKLLVAWPEKTPNGSEKTSALEVVNQPGNESAKGHFLIGQFKRPDTPRDGFTSVIQFRGAA